MNKYKVPYYIHKLYKNDRVIVVNFLTGKWIKLSRELWNIVEKNQDKQSIDEIIDCYELEEDKRVLRKLFENMVTKGIIVSEEEIRPYVFTFALTKRCNLYCKHCSFNAICSDDYAIDKLDFSYMKKIINQIARLNLEAIVFTGGEPMIHQEFFEILEYTRSNFNGCISVMTNATLISKENVHRLCQNATQIDISMDGVDEESCSKIRGKGVFNKVIEAVKMLQNEGFENISLSMVDTAVTHPYIDAFKKLNKELHTKPVIREFAEIGRGEENADQLRNKKENKNIPQTEALLYKIQSRLLCSRCGACFGNFFINYDGKIYGCANLKKEEYMLGNIFEIDDFKEYIQKEKYLQSDGYKKIFAELPEKCKECDVNIFCINCLADLISLQKKGNLDEYCIRKRKMYEKLVWELD